MNEHLGDSHSKAVEPDWKITDGRNDQPFSQVDDSSTDMS